MSSDNPGDLNARLGLIGRLVFGAITCVIVIVLAGGWTFLKRPFGAIYIGLLLLWMITAIGRRRGVNSAYEQSQSMIYALLGVIYFTVFFVAPLEYSHYSGPIPRDGLISWIGLIIFALGIAARSWALWSLHGLYTVRLGIQPGHSLVTSGPYRFTRHPGYFGEILSVLGMGLALSSISGLSMVILLALVVIIRVDAEERMLLAEFGDNYRNYAMKTKKLVPFIF
jgi:protein-S-isoprenylcysteine O-methyltransferase Ste14